MEHVAGDLELFDPETSLADILDHLLNRGVCVSGSITISVAGIDLMYLGVRVLFASVATLRERSPGAREGTPGVGAPAGEALREARAPAGEALREARPAGVAP
jgi:hypothetical protein